MTLRLGLIVFVAIGSSYRAAAQKSTPEITIELTRFLHPAGRDVFLLKCVAGDEACQAMKLSGDTTTATGIATRQKVSVWIDQFYRTLPKGEVKASAERPANPDNASYSWYVRRGDQGATGVVTREQFSSPTPEFNRRTKALAALEVRVQRALKPVKK